MKFQSYTFSIAHQLGTYQAIAGMMRDAIRDLEAAKDDFDREWSTKRLAMLADQLDEAEEKIKKGVDTVAA